MGLGKTLQGISLLWTLLRQGTDALGGSPMARRVIIVCPTSLVSNWENECIKWLKGKLRWVLAMVAGCWPIMWVLVSGDRWERKQGGKGQRRAGGGGGQTRNQAHASVPLGHRALRVLQG